MMKDSKKRILVTGGAGMIGTTLCSRLLAEGSEVFCLDNLQTGSKWNIRDMLDNELFHFLEKDITNPLDLDVDEITASVQGNGKVILNGRAGKKELKNGKNAVLEDNLR